MNHDSSRTATLFVGVITLEFSRKLVVSSERQQLGTSVKAADYLSNHDDVFIKSKGHKLISCLCEI